MANTFKDQEVVYVRGTVDWEFLDDGREPPVDMPVGVALTVVVNEDGTIDDIIDEDWG